MAKAKQNATCERCAGTGILFAGLVKNKETFANEAIKVVICDHFDPETEENLAAIATMGIPLDIRNDGKPEQEPS